MSSGIKIPASIIIAGSIVAAAVVWGGRAGPVDRSPVAGSAAKVTQVVDSEKVDASGDPFIGRADAPVTMAYWYDYQCPFCQRHEIETMPVIVKKYVDTGKLKILFKDFQFLGLDSQTLAEYSRAVWELVPQKFYQWHQAIYENQGAENTGWATEARIGELTAAILGETDTRRVTALVKEKGMEYRREMDADKAEGGALGISGTPAAIIGKAVISGAQPLSAFEGAIEQALSASRL